MAIQTVALLSPGDMGHSVGKVLHDHGLRVITCFEGRSQRQDPQILPGSKTAARSKKSSRRPTCSSLSLFLPGR